MGKRLIAQAVYVPIIYFGTIILASLFANGYSQVGQQVSELALNESTSAGTVLTVGIFITGLSLVLLGIGMIQSFKSQFIISSFLIILFGISFLCGALIPMGSPWHSLYGLSISILLLPFAFLYEMGDTEISNLTRNLAIIVTLIIFVYFWDMLAVHFAPAELRGLTQRIFGVAVFGWFSYSAYILKNLILKDKNGKVFIEDDKKPATQ